MVQVAIIIHSELQLLSSSAWYYTPSVATGQWFELQLIYALSCQYWVLPPDSILPPWVAMQQWFELQLIYTPSCKYWMLPLDTILLLQLQPNSGSSCNWYTVRVANTRRFHLILYYPFSCNRIVVRVAIEYTLSCKYLVLPPDTILPLQLQPDTSSSCNWYTHRVVNTKCFRLILYHPFRCNQTVVRVAIDTHSELQILSASVWYYTTPSVASGQ
jgi:hypothetical protein